MNSAPSSAPAAAPLPARRGIDPRWLSASLVTLILAVGQYQFNILAQYSNLVLGLGVAVLAELVLSRWLRGEWPNLLSAYISGNSIAIMVRSSAGLLWPFWGGALVSIVSKYVLNYKGRHLWNPTNFGVCALLLLAPDSMHIMGHEFGNEWWTVAVVWAVGLVVVTRAKVWHITLAYLGSFLALAALRSALNGNAYTAEIGPVTGVMYQFFMFFMITDPKTIVKGRALQLAVVALIALLECVIRLGIDFDVRALQLFAPAPPMFALFLVGPLALWWQLRSQPARASR